MSLPIWQSLNTNRARRDPNQMWTYSSVDIPRSRTRLPHITTVLAVVAITSSSIVKSPTDGQNFELLILHNNDMHARFEQTSQMSGACTTADREAGKCYGGFPRVAHVVKEARKAAASGEGPPVLYLNAGDTYTGTAWFTVYKWKVAAEFLNALQPDAVSLGNNELENGSTELSPLLQNLETAILASNVIIDTKEAKQIIQKSIVKDIEGIKVGIIGYLTPILDGDDTIEYIDEVRAVNEEVAKLKANGVKIIIALGHSALTKAVELATEVDGIDLVINGHKNLFSSKANIEDSTKKEIVVVQKSSKRVPVVQSYAYNKHLGKIHIVFNADGEISDYKVDSILLDDTVSENAEITDIIQRYKRDVSASTPIGSTVVFLEGNTCKVEECNFGNLVADSIVYYYALRHQGERWTDAPVAIISGNSFAGNIRPLVRPFRVSRQDLITTIAESSNLVVVTLSGVVLKQALEHSVSEYSTHKQSDSFLQLSGIRLVYDLEKERGSRLSSAVVRCWDCSIPEFFAINDTASYKIIMPATLASGSYGFSMLANQTKEELDYDAITCTEEYIKKRSPSLGNHEFDNGVSGLTPFIRNLSCPTLAANLILTSEPTLEAEKKIMKSVVFNINGIKIGIIGYLTPETKTLAIRNNVEYIEEIIAIREELNRLKNEGIQIFVALGHSGFDKDLEIAEKVDDIDLVIGGHTNTFLWNGKTIDSEIPQGPYPTLVKQKSGRQVPVVQAYAYTKYLGKLHLIFDFRGEIISFDGNPILLNNSVPQDPSVLSIVHRYRENIEQISESVIGSSSVLLDGLTCRLQECNLGNLIADAMVDKHASEYTGEGWTDAPIAVMQGGGIRASISHVDQLFNVTKGDLYTVMPFAGNLVKIAMNGSNILKMLEHSVANYNIIRAPGQFLQVSGLKVEYDFIKPPGARVVKVLARCGKCKIPVYEILNKTAEYNILSNGFLANGGDGFQSLGNHEFDQGVSGLSPFIENLTCPVLAANLILTKVPELEREANLRKSVVFNISGTSVGVIGYLTPETKMLAVKNDVEYIDEIVAVKEEVQKLKSEGVHIIIGLGHSGYLRDLEIANAVDGLNLVIGGHSNTFLWNGTSPDSEKSLGPYPTYVSQASGKQVPVVQAYAYTKYLGKLHMVFNKKGELLSADGIPILLDKTIPQDPSVLEIVKRYRDQILNYTEEVIGTTSVVLNGLDCQHEECNMGNLITDAMIYRYASEYKGKNHWTDAPIAVLQGGGVRSSIAHAEMPANITKGDLIAVMPFQGYLVVVTMSGNVLMQMLEHSIGNFSELDYPGEFLQVSGLRVVYDNSKPRGSKVVSAEARCWNCSIPEFSEVVNDEEYNVIMPYFMYSGGDEYTMLSNLPSRTLNYSELDCTLSYIRKHSPVLPALERRVVVLGESSLGNHEFDEEVGGVIPFIRNLSCPIVTANLILKKVPELVNIPNLYNSTVIVKSGVKIGIIGYLTPETKFLAPKNNVEYEDEILALNREVRKLKDLGIHILIALGHSGFLKDLEIAEKVDDIDLVIGGHSNTFLLNSNSTGEIPEYPAGPYPTLVQQKSGRKVPVVQAYAYTKYLGKLHLIFNDKGEIVRYDGYPILLNKDVPEDPEVLEIVKRYQKDIDRINDVVVGTSLVFLDGDSCRLRECNMGNFINDAIIDYTKKYFKNSPPFYIAITQGGRLRTSISRPEKPFNITRGDIITVMPYSDTLCLLTMNGTVLTQALEHSVEAWRTIDTPGQFLQYSGVEVVYDLAQKPGSRIVKAAAVCSECPELIDLQDNYEYKVVTSTFIADGGDGYTMFETLPRDILPYNEVDSAIEYLVDHSPINTVLSNRTIILNADKVATVPKAHIIYTIPNAVAIQLNTKMYLLLVVVFIHCIF
ncbi:uncharacterized protein [Maniola hyperantus]|uniref:uncharacterized protein n=1 Tax=Aphantopus hyperantus TaxID=2795564 RepID=UPI003748DA5A